MRPSLGSVIAYDALNALLNEDALNQHALKVAERTRVLATFGSPLDKIAYVFSLAGQHTSDTRPKNGATFRDNHPLDEAMQAGRDVASFPAADEDYFHDMDGALPLTPEQIQGRNMWLVWTGGNDRLWDVLSRESFGSLDFLKTIVSTLISALQPVDVEDGLVNGQAERRAVGAQEVDANAIQHVNMDARDIF